MPRAAKPPPSENDLVRDRPGEYHSGDARFRVEQGEVGWFLIDTQQMNEFGQPLMHGPLATLVAVRQALPGARKVTPLPARRTPVRRTGVRRTSASKGRKASTQRAAKREAPAPSPPTSWLDGLPAKEAAEARRLIKALEREGLADAEELVQHHRRDADLTIVTRLIERRLALLTDGLPEAERERARALVERVARVLTVEGASVGRPAPGWALVEVAADASPPGRRIRLE